MKRKTKKGFRHEKCCGMYGLAATCTCKYYARWKKNYLKRLPK